MELKEIIEQQIDAAITALLQTREKIKADPGKDEFHEIGRHLEAAAYHVDDIQFNCKSLAGSRPGSVARQRRNGLQVGVTG